jgi:arsenical pump membrane protein
LPAGHVGDADFPSQESEVLTEGKAVVLAIFTLSSAATIYLILRRPFLRIRARNRHIRLDTYFLGALLGPVLILATGILGYERMIDGINGQAGPRPLGILTLFLSMVFISVFLDITGVFEYFARLALQWARTDGVRLFFALYVTIALLTIFTSNDIIILTFTPFVYYLAREADINPTPYLIAEFFAANTWSMMLYIGNPTNILLASAFHIDFVQYTAWMLLPTLAAGVVNVGVLYLLFRRQIRKPIVIQRPITPSAAITDRAGAIIGGAVLVGCVIALAVAPYWRVSMWAVSLTAALILLAVLLARDSHMRYFRRRIGHVALRHSVGDTFRRMPWAIVPFVLSLFITVEALRLYGITADVGDFLARLCGESTALSVLVYGAGSALSANLLNNIPMTVAFASIIGGLSGRPLLAAALATTIGSNLGANITPIGALAGIMWMSILHDKEHRLSFGEFVRYGLIATPASLAACLGVLAAQMVLFAPGG